MNRRLHVVALISLALAACAGAAATSHPWTPEATADGWSPAGGSTRQVGLGWPGGAALAKGVRYAGGVQLIAAPWNEALCLRAARALEEAGVARLKK